jgi:hypothetical protein
MALRSHYHHNNIEHQYSAININIESNSSIENKRQNSQTQELRPIVEHNSSSNINSRPHHSRARVVTPESPPSASPSRNLTSDESESESDSLLKGKSRFGTNKVV